MRNHMKAVALTAATVAGPLTSGETQERADLDAFLGDFARTCMPTEAFEDYLGTLNGALLDNVGVKSVPTFPIGQRPWYTITVVPDAFGFKVDLNATYLGLEVTQINLGLGRHSGFAVHTLTFDASEKELHSAVEERLGPVEDRPYPYRDTRTDEDGNAVLICNLGV